MSKAVLQARYVGQAPDLRHPLAPPEHVFVCEEPRRTLRDRLATLTAPRIYALVCLGICIWGFGRALVAAVALIS